LNLPRPRSANAAGTGATTSARMQRTRRCAAAAPATSSVPVRHDSWLERTGPPGRWQQSAPADVQVPGPRCAGSALASLCDSPVDVGSRSAAPTEADSAARPSANASMPANSTRKRPTGGLSACLLGVADASEVVVARVIDLDLENTVVAGASDGRGRHHSVMTTVPFCAISGAVSPDCRLGAAPDREQVPPDRRWLPRCPAGGRPGSGAAGIRPDAGPGRLRRHGDNRRPQRDADSQPHTCPPILPRACGPGWPSP